MCYFFSSFSGFLCFYQFRNFSLNKSCQTYLNHAAIWCKKMAADYPSLISLNRATYRGHPSLVLNATALEA